MIRFTGEVDGIVELDRAFNRVEQYISDSARSGRM